MKILGDELIKFEPLFLCSNEADVLSGRQNLFKFDRNLIKRALEAGASFSIIANAAGAKFIIADIDIAKDLAKMAESYLFDALIAVLIKDENELVELAKFNIDAAILPNAIKQ